MKSTRPRTPPPADEAPEAFARVIAEFRSDRSVTLARRFSSKNVLSVDGKIFAMFVRGEFVAKLPHDRVDELLRSGVGKAWGPGTGRIMKEWVAVPHHPERWPALAREAHGFVTSAR